MGDVLTTIESWVAKDPGRLLYSFLDVNGHELERLTRETFYRRVLTIASHLQASPILRPGSRVLLAYPPGLEMICALFACTRAGLIPAPVAAPVTQGLQAALYKMEYIARDCQAQAILTTQECRDHVLSHLAGSRPSGSFPTGLGLTCIGALSWIATDEISEMMGGVRDPCRSPLLFLQYTSGSTSQPKGVMVSHDNILTNAHLVVDHESAVGVSWLPQHHDMGLIGYCINNALVGGTLYSFAPTTFIRCPALWLETITKYQATATSAPNFAFEYCLRSGRIPPARLETLDLSSLKFLMAAAEPIKPAVYQRFLRTFMPYGLKQRAFVVAYGLAENTLAVSNYGRDSLSVSRRALGQGRVKVTTNVADVSAATHVMSCGRPLGDTEVLIVDPERRRSLTDNNVGEIWVSGESKCLGYWNNSPATVETFHARLVGANGKQPTREYLRTGDMGFLREGELYVCGRHKDMIIVRGQNYYPQDIEAIVEQASDAIRAGGIAAFELGEGDEQRVAIVAEQISRKATPDGGAITAAIRDYLGVEVHRIYFVPPKSVPKTSSGKVMRYMAKQMLLDGKFEVLQDVATLRPADDDRSSVDLEGPFAHFRTRYKLRGDEPFTLVEAGLDSLDIVLFLHEVAEILTAKGAAELAEKVDFRLVQELTIAELFRLAARFESAPEAAIAQIRHFLVAKREAGHRAEQEMMVADRTLAFEPGAISGPPSSGSAQTILLTGATGFLGPFLLTSLLEQTQAKIYALVRAPTHLEGQARLRANLEAAAPQEAIRRAFESRVAAVPGDLAQPRLGLTQSVWNQLAAEVDTIYHNGALVNYLFTYKQMRPANVLGTNDVLRLAFEGRSKILNYVSTTFIFGWATTDVLSESDSNAQMELLDFGYSQSKWVAEQLVLDARRRGLTTRIFRPALITPSIDGGGDSFDITLRLLAFMIKHGISVNARNQVSFVPADVIANNIVAVSTLPETANETFHMTRDAYCNMSDVLAIITRLTGRRFALFDLAAFVPEVIRRCTRDDLLYPLLDFLVGSIDNISSMEFKRYENIRYQQAREAAPCGLPDPSLEDTVAGILRFMKSNGLPDLAISFVERPAASLPSKGQERRRPCSAIS
jgi:thioester reductase-like protein